jgi:hypothetical protein
MPLAVDPSLSDSSRRRELLTICRDKGWFDYESENPPGFVDDQGVRRAGYSYTVVLYDGTLRLTVDADLIDGFIYREAVERDDVAAIAWRKGM